MAMRDFAKFNKPPSFGDLEFEQLASRIWQLLLEAKVERTSEVIQLATGDFQDELGLIILISPDAMELRLPTLTWSGPHTPVKTSRLWQRFNLDELKESQLSKLIVEAQAQQQASFSDCKHCQKHKPKGLMHSLDICQSCAEKDLGIVH